MAAEQRFIYTGGRRIDIPNDATNFSLVMVELLICHSVKGIKDGAL